MFLTKISIRTKFQRHSPGLPSLERVAHQRVLLYSFDRSLRCLSTIEVCHLIDLIADTENSFSQYPVIY